MPINLGIIVLGLRIFNRQIHLSRFSAYPDGSPSQLIPEKWRSTVLHKISNAHYVNAP